MPEFPSSRCSKTLALLMGLFLGGCVSSGWYPSSPLESSVREISNRTQMLEHTALKSLFDDIASEVCSVACDKTTNPAGRQSETSASDCSGETILVTDFVDLQSFVPEKNGLLMGDLMRGSLSGRCGYRIVQVEFSSFFRLSENGLVVLSRNDADILHKEYRNTECIVGTYSFVGNKMIVIVRLVNRMTGRIMKMATRELDYVRCGDTISYSVK